MMKTIEDYVGKKRLMGNMRAMQGYLQERVAEVEMMHSLAKAYGAGDYTSRQAYENERKIEDIKGIIGELDTLYKGGRYLKFGELAGLYDGFAVRANEKLEQIKECKRL